MFHLMIYCAILYMNYSWRGDVALSASFAVRKFGDVTKVAVEINVHNESVVVEKIKEVELRSRRGQFIYSQNDNPNGLHSYSRHCYAPSRLPVKKLKSLLQKKRNVRHILATLTACGCVSNCSVAERHFCWSKLL